MDFENTCLPFGHCTFHFYLSDDTIKSHENPKIYHELNGMDQNNPKLIEAIKTKVLWQPPQINSAKPEKGKLNLKTKDLNDVIEGQFGQPLFVEEILQDAKLFRDIAKLRKLRKPQCEKIKKNCVTQILREINFGD